MEFQMKTDDQEKARWPIVRLVRHLTSYKIDSVSRWVSMSVDDDNRKKLSGHSSDWSQPSHNYVAKSYMEDVSRDVYFEDVRLQMDAKLWGEEFSRHNPPKKVCIFITRWLNVIQWTICNYFR